MLQEVGTTYLNIFSDMIRTTTKKTRETIQEYFGI